MIFRWNNNATSTTARLLDVKRDRNIVLYSRSRSKLEKKGKSWFFNRWNNNARFFDTWKAYRLQSIPVAVEMKEERKKSDFSIGRSTIGKFYVCIEAKTRWITRNRRSNCAAMRSKLKSNFVCSWKMCQWRNTDSRNCNRLYLKNDRRYNNVVDEEIDRYERIYFPLFFRCAYKTQLQLLFLNEIVDFFYNIRNNISII